MLKRQTFLVLAVLVSFGLFTSLSAGAHNRENLSSSGYQPYHRLQATPPVAELPPDTKTLSLDKPLIDTLDSNASNRLYKFEGKANEMLRLSVEPKIGNFFVTITVLQDDLQTILGGTVGDDIVGGDVIVTLPDDGTYVVSVDYADSMVGTPTPGSFQLKLSPFKLS